MKMMKIGITGLKKNPLARATARKAIKILESVKVTVETDRNFLGKGKALEKFSSDLVLSFGGDGTLLRTFRELRKEIPVLGINCGRTGYLQAFNHQELEDGLRSVLKKEFKIEKRTRIQARVDGKRTGEALNEVLVVPKKAGRILRYTLRVARDSRDEAGDGFIVSTPTGSTAHSLSAGGPIVKGNAAVFVVVSINPVDWKHRPLIINDHEKITLSEFGNVKAEAIIDGQKRFPIKRKIELVKGKSVLLATREQKH